MRHCEATPGHTAILIPSLLAATGQWLQFQRARWLLYQSTPFSFSPNSRQSPHFETMPKPCLISAAMCLHSFFFFTSLEENVSTTSNEDANELTIKREEMHEGNTPFVAKYTISRRKLTRREIQLAPSGAAFPTSCINLRHVVYLAHVAPECPWFGGLPV